MKATVQMLVVIVGGWVEGEVDQVKAPVQMVVKGGGVGRGRGRSIESTSTNVGGGSRVVGRRRGRSI